MMYSKVRWVASFWQDKNKRARKVIAKTVIGSFYEIFLVENVPGL